MGVYDYRATFWAIVARSTAYDADYLASADAEAVSLTLPLSDKPGRVDKNIIAKFAKAKDKWFEFIDLSFLPDEMKEAFKVIIAEKLSLLA